MRESNVIPFLGPKADWDDPSHVAEWLTHLPPTTLPPTKLTAHYSAKVDGKTAYVRITRAAQVAIAGSDEPSTLQVISRYEAEIDRQIEALVARGPQPATGWLLDVTDLIA